MDQCQGVQFFIDCDITVLEFADNVLALRQNLVTLQAAFIQINKRPPEVSLEIKDVNANVILIPISCSNPALQANGQLMKLSWFLNI